MRENRGKLIISSCADKKRHRKGISVKKRGGEKERGKEGIDGKTCDWRDAAVQRGG